MPKAGWPVSGAPSTWSSGYRPSIDARSTSRQTGSRKGPTVGSYATTWLADRCERDPHDPQALRPSSVKDYRLLLANHISPGLGNIPLSELKAADIEAWYRKLGVRRIPRARAKAYSLLRTILNSAKNDPDMQLSENPAHIKGAGRASLHPDPPCHARGARGDHRRDA